MEKVTIGIQIVPQWGVMSDMRVAWMEAEALGVDAIYSCDHFFPQVHTSEVADGEIPKTPDGHNFEGTTVQAAMAVTTTRPEIGCIVHANGYRNPNLLADIARTVDHISNGRFVLGIGAGVQERDYREYGYEFGTTKSRLMDLARDLPIIKARLEKLNPKPIRKIPIMIASMGEKIGMRIVAEHADRWNIFGEHEKVQHKIGVLKSLCKEVGRDFAEIEINTYYFPHLQQGKDTDPGKLVDMGIRHIIYLCHGPNWDLGPLLDLIAWRNALS